MRVGSKGRPPSQEADWEPGNLLGGSDLQPPPPEISGNSDFQMVHVGAEAVVGAGPEAGAGTGAGLLGPGWEGRRSV